MIVLLAITISLNSIICFLIGARIGQKIPKNEELPTINPVKIVHEIQDREERNKELEKMQVIAENIDGYDGTSNGQKDIPR